MLDLVLLSGPQGSGKSTTALAVRKQAKLKHGYEMVLEAKFADPLYTLHEYLLNTMQRWTTRPRVKKDGKLLQLLGTEWGREVFGPDVWVDIMKNKIIGEKQRYSKMKKLLLVIDDCRFENEFNGFPDALRVRLEANEAVRKTRTESWRENTAHPSETSLDQYAINGLFDLYLKTDLPESNADDCATAILGRLQTRDWFDYRTKF